MEQHPSNTKGLRAIDLAYISLFAVIIAVCSWISIPSTVPFTMQTFAVFATLGLLGGKRGTLSVLLYLLLGAVGIPVFAGFGAGLGTLLGATGGYLVGFLLMALVYWLITGGGRENNVTMIIGMLVGLLLCYTFGTVWFLKVYAAKSGPIGLMTALGWCVFPFIIPDLAKGALAFFLVKKLKPHVKL